MNKISSLLDEAGNVVNKEEDMAAVAKVYFQKLFQTSSPSHEAIEQIVDLIPRSINASVNNVLLKDFTKEEVIEAPNSMESS